LVAALALCGALLGACGSSSPSSSAFHASSDCAVSVTNTDYDGCDLAHRDLRGVDLQGDHLVRTDLVGADLDGANLQGADVSGARTTGVRTDEATVCVNSVFGPCTRPGLRGKDHTEGS
jgi:uncharacterized protein YjbI with pentapeptide repeats